MICADWLRIARKATHSQYCCIKVHLQHQHLHNHQIQFQTLKHCKESHSRWVLLCQGLMCLLQHRRGTQAVAQPAESEGKFFKYSIFSAIFKRSLTSRESVGRLPVDGGVAVVLGGPGQENTLVKSFCKMTDVTSNFNWTKLQTT